MSAQTRITLSKATEPDLEGIARLSAQLGYPCALADLQKRFSELRDNPNQLIAVARQGDAVHGFIHANLFLDLIEPHSVQIIALVVDENVRSAGIGASLVRFVEEWTKSLGVRNLWVRSNIKRDRAHSFYLRAGYQHAKTSHKFAKIIE